MRTLYSTLLILFLTAGLYAQQSVLDPNGNGGPDRPVIDNISAVTIGPELLDNKDVLHAVQPDRDYGNGQNGNQADNPDANQMGGNLYGGSNDPVFENIRQNLRIYPNPAVNYLVVDLGGEAEVEVSLVNIIGRRVYYRNLTIDKLTIDLSSIPAGAYFLTIRRGDNIMARRVEISSK